MTGAPMPPGADAVIMVERTRGGPDATVVEVLEGASVTEVARHIDLGSPDLRLPLTPADPAALVALSEAWNLESPIARLVETLTGLH